MPFERNKFGKSTFGKPGSSHKHDQPGPPFSHNPLKSWKPKYLPRNARKNIGQIHQNIILQTHMFLFLLPLVGTGCFFGFASGHNFCRICLTANQKRNPFVKRFWGIWFSKSPSCGRIGMTSSTNRDVFDNSLENINGNLKSTSPPAPYGHTSYVNSFTDFHRFRKSPNFFIGINLPRYARNDAANKPHEWREFWSQPQPTQRGPPSRHLLTSLVI